MSRYQGQWFEMYYREPKDDGGICTIQNIQYNYDATGKYDLTRSDWFGVSGNKLS